MSNISLKVYREESGEIRRAWEDQPPPAATADNPVVVRIEYSSLNYKDALAATGHPGVARRFPLVPGIDAAGTVVESLAPDFRPGDSVLIFHAKFGTERDGGYTRHTAVPADWVYPLPAGLNLREAMTLGTAGFTAAQCVDAIVNRHGAQPADGEMIVSGATGGVGIFAVKILSRLGFSVVAATGKPEAESWLKHHGAQSIAPREALDDRTDRPLLAGRWAAAVDTVGSHCLGTIVRSTKPHGCVTACGLAGGSDFPVTVFPFILRGVALYGIDTAGISPDYRRSLWERLAGEWKLPDILEIGQLVPLADLESSIKAILAGKIRGRVVVSLAD